LLWIFAEADRVIVYYLHSFTEAEALAAGGWRWGDPLRSDLGVGCDWRRDLEASIEPVAYNRWPPGIPPRHPDVEGAEQAPGLCPLAQEKRVGFILCHTTRRPAFLPKEISLLKTLAQQTALGIQRSCWWMICRTRSFNCRPHRKSWPRRSALNTS
jgi:hypothetical protein